MRADEVILEPLLTEKSNGLREQNKYSFVVSPRANKIEVMKAVEALFDVKPQGCNIVSVKGKPRRVRFAVGKTASWKKAVVTLKAGDTISIFEGA
ncbi:50S ribosomal protein L23 [Salinispira pacifica]|uniref:Large ribosomal subunit protein uL23 n=1 Tax=Salinispira pacifica TaxID=1307761 RepID=V5WFG1_9SPIO|nr:50S ribosomal protein L23 [Salinispira pacifica]AHC14299.1 LSU ribosomal protein L23p (L23Ae) [Salinispira pacifica]